MSTQPCDYWEEYRLPELCKAKIEDVCRDILKRGEDTNYSRLYDLIYEYIEEDINEEVFRGYNY